MKKSLASLVSCRVKREYSKELPSLASRQVKWNIARTISSLCPAGERGYSENISEDTQEMPQLRSTAFPFLRHHWRYWKQTDKTNATYETTNARTTTNSNKGTPLERSEEKLLGGGVSSQLYSPYILMKLQIHHLSAAKWQVNIKKTISITFVLPRQQGI